MIDFKFEEDFKNFSLSSSNDSLFSSKINEKCFKLNEQKVELERFLSDRSNECLLKDINYADLIPIVNEFHTKENKEEILIINENSSQIQSRQKLLKILDKIKEDKFISAKETIEKLRERLQKIQGLFQNYNILKKQLELKNEHEIIMILFTLKQELQEFTKEDLKYKLFKHLKKKIDHEYENQLENFKKNKINEFYSLENDVLKIEVCKSEFFFGIIPTNFKEFKTVFNQKILEILLEKMKIVINQDFYEFTKLIIQNTEEKTLSIIQFEYYKEQIPTNENEIENFVICIQNFFTHFFGNIEVISKFQEEDSDDVKENLKKIILEFLKTINLRIYQKSNKILLSNKIKEIETKCNSNDYFKRKFHNDFENIQYDEISVKNRLNLLEFKDILLDIMKKIKKEQKKKELFRSLNEKVRVHIESLEKHYAQIEIDYQKHEENTKIFHSFLNYFQLILELMSIFDEEMQENSAIFYNCMISILNLAQNGLNKLISFFINKNEEKENSFFKMVFHLTKKITNMETKYLNKISTLPETSIN